MSLCNFSHTQFEETNRGAQFKILIVYFFEVTTKKGNLLNKFYSRIIQAA